MGRPVSFGDDSAGLFDWFTTRAFRLETLDQYAVGYEEEAIRRFLAGKPLDRGFIAPWLEHVATATGAGRQMQRVHVVTEPLGDYLRYEIDGYQYSVRSCERSLSGVPVKRASLKRESPNVKKEVRGIG